MCNLKNCNNQTTESLNTADMNYEWNIKAANLIVTKGGKLTNHTQMSAGTNRNRMTNSRKCKHCREKRINKMLEMKDGKQRRF